MVRLKIKGSSLDRLRLGPDVDRLIEMSGASVAWRGLRRETSRRAILRSAVEKRWKDWGSRSEEGIVIRLPEGHRES